MEQAEEKNILHFDSLVFFSQVGLYFTSILATIL